MNQSSGALYEIRWNEVCPSLVLVRALRVSVMVRVLLLATAGVVLTHWGWSIVDGIMPTTAPRLARLDQSTTRAIQYSEIGGSNSDGDGPLLPAPLTGQADLHVNESPLLLDSIELAHWGGPLVRAWAWLSDPFVRTARSATDRGATSWKHSIALCLCGLWTIAVWALLGGAISRIAALHLTRSETPGPLAALREAVHQWTATAGAPLIPLIGSALFAIPLMLTGLLLRSDFLSLVVGLVWILVIIWGLLLAVVMIGLLVGWPLMWATIGVERTDAFDGVSRCYAYVYQRPLQMACYIAFAVVLGWLGQLAVEYFAIAAVALSEWAVSWGAGGERIAELTTTSESNLTGMAATGSAGIGFWKSALQVLVESYSLAYLWSAAVGIYLLLRRHVDSTEMDEVSIDQSAGGLPPLKDDPSGVPVMEPSTSSGARADEQE